MHTMKKSSIRFLLPLIAAIAAPPVGASAAGAPSVVVDGEPLTLPIEPAIVQDTAFVPLRGVFERQGAEVVWDDATRTVQATKGERRFTYVVGENEAALGGERLEMRVPGFIRDGSTLVPLRVVSEALGSVVNWDASSGTISIASAPLAEATVTWGVNFRSEPNTTGSSVYRMLPKGETLQVLQELDGGWLRARTADGAVGYVSADPKYTDFVSPRAADRLIAYGETFLGTPYRFGASPGQTDTFDCSSFVKHVFLEVLGIELPRVSYNQAEKGEKVEKDDLRKGDLLFFSARGLPIGHVAIYAGDGMMLHTYSEKSGVEFRAFDGSWEERFAGARRLF